MKKLLYVRHGLTKMNMAGLLSGRSETKLTTFGRKQAIATGKKLMSGYPDINLIVCSPASRTYETAKLIAGEIKYPLSNILQSDLFIERSFGTLEGTLKDDFIGQHSYRAIDFVEGAETIEALDQRAAEAYSWLQSLDYETILVVGHGAFGRALRRIVNSLPYTNEYEAIATIDNAEIVELL